ncbi:MAG: hypothetical protein COZ12_00050 [Deltaproteobacteria bacterium CG_4_10_14_3_um_filter_60_8]|nr:MAG: hypothetical protein COZ12_00050 [Deltaproteobacteria bacterium CG_4_10_14_3_um_filter_60_8]
MRVEVRPAFDEAIMAAKPRVRKAAAKMLHLLQAFSLTELWSHTGLNFEKLHGMIEPASGAQLYSLRVSGAVRAIACLRQGPIVVLVSLHVQHDKAYRK